MRYDVQSHPTSAYPTTSAQQHERVSEEMASIITAQLKLLMEQEYVYRDPSLTIEKVAQRLSTNRSYLSIVLNQIMGRSFSQYVNRYRIEDAKQLLAATTRKVDVVGQLVGFRTPSVFYRIFQQMEGCSPGQYRQRARRRALHIQLEVAP